MYNSAPYYYAGAREYGDSRTMETERMRNIQDAVQSSAYIVSVTFLHDS